MADSTDKLTPSDEAKLAELEKQLTKETDQSKAEKIAPSATNSSKGVEKQPRKTDDALVIKSTDKDNKIKESTPPPKEADKSKGKTRVLWIVTIFNLLILVVIIGLGYWVWMQWQTQNQQQTDTLTAQQTGMKQQQLSMQQQKNSLDQQQNDIAQSIASSQRASSDFERQSQTLNSSVQSVMEQLKQTNAQVQSNQRNLADVSGRRPADWLLAEADYLVRMAGRKLWLENDVKTAAMMLQSADSRIQDLDDPSLLPLREKLADDLQSLQQLEPVSTSSIALALGAMVKQVDNLPLAFFKKPENAARDETVTESIDDWRSNLARNWREATKSFFSFKKVTVEIKPFMSEQQQWLSREQLKFTLMQSQIAVLQENSILFQQSLETAFALLSESYDIEKDSVIQFIDNLNELQLTNFEQKLPEQFKVAPLLQDVIEQRLNSRFVNGTN